MTPHEEGELVVHRALLPYWMLPELRACAPGHLHVVGLEALWLRLADGQAVRRPPKPPEDVSPSLEVVYRQGKPPAALQRWEALLEDSSVVRALELGSGTLLDVHRLSRSGRSLAWGSEEPVRPLVSRLAWEDRIESVGEGRVAWVRPKDGALELLEPQAQRRWCVALPSWLAEGIREVWRGGSARNLWSLPTGPDVLALSSRYALAWMDVEALHALPRLSAVRWRTVDHQPLADLDARVGGEVVFTGPSSVMVNLDDLTQLRLPPLKGLKTGQRVEFVGRLSSASGRAEYLWLEHGGGRLQLQPEPPGEESFPVEARALGKSSRKKRATAP